MTRLLQSLRGCPDMLAAMTRLLQSPHLTPLQVAVSRRSLTGTIAAGAAAHTRRPSGNGAAATAERARPAAAADQVPRAPNGRSAISSSVPGATSRRAALVDFPPRPSSAPRSGSRRSVLTVRGDSLFLVNSDHFWARPDLHVPPAWRPRYAGFYNTYSTIRLQDVAASLAGEMDHAMEQLDTLPGADAVADVEYFEDVLLDTARGLLLAAAAAETTVLQRQLQRQL